jgi:glycosyltransferase involved in cell wall biosynthesis
VHTVPHIVGRPPGSRLRRRRSDRFVFYLIATWTTRKAILDAVSAFVRAFTAHDAVELVIHTTPEDHIARARIQRGETPHPPSEGDTWFSLARALAGRRSVPHITLSTRLLDLGELDYLHTESDCFLLLSHGEGWGLGAFDAAASGNPVIVTGWGGTLEFLPEGYPYVVEYDLLTTTTAEPDAWWEPQPAEPWANARIDHAAELLRRVFEHRDEARQWGTALQSHVHESFSEARVIRALIDALDGKSTHPRPRAPVWRGLS